MNNEPDLRELKSSVRHAIATAKIAELEHQSFRVGDYVATKFLSPATAGDLLYDVALANGLVREHGDDIIQAIIAEGLTYGAGGGR